MGNSQGVAFISDIHSNVDALGPVLESIWDKLGKEAEIYCAGDIVGYGGWPWECYELVERHAKGCVRGNHDDAALWDPDHFSEGAWESIVWTRARLEEEGKRKKKDAFEFFDQLPRKLTVHGALLVHGSPRNPTNEYVKPTDVYTDKMMEGIAAVLPDIGFNGHTHLPGVLSFGTKPPVFTASSGISGRIVLPKGVKHLVNVGSVGQPRDRDPRACYVIFYPATREIEYVRVEYPIEQARAKILAQSGLRNEYGDRLLDGR